MLTDYFDSFLYNYAPYKSGAWCYEDGLIYRGLEVLYKATEDERYLEALRVRVDAKIDDDGHLRGYDPNDYNIDNVQSGRALVALTKITGEQRYLDVASQLMRQLTHHPRTKSGVYWHKLRYPWQVWLDGLYMGPPFQISYAQATDQPDLITDAITQISTAMEMTHNPQTALYAHAVDEARMQPWADPVTGQNPAHWSRALGWLAMALVDVAELVGTKAFAPLEARTREFLTAIAAHRTPNGLWQQVFDQPDLNGNYEESSASAMFTYALVKGIDLGLWDGNRDGLVQTLFDGVMKAKNGGGLEMVNMCHVAGLGLYEDRFRDGSAAYYISEATCSDDAKGVGPLMMCQALDLSAGVPR
ncbi:glycoside hydrolase family 88/105 protein [Celeribacter sp.]|uniref:glycoside hydrolase family 88/105 protein n=1 Tax=Celeribacter sp. TaxID=1890673 RepID=UPI003A9528EC